jgi:hypothetical protein
MRHLLTLLAAAAALLSTQVSADVYKWVDRNGRIHYSDQLPEGARVISIEDRLSLYSPEPAVALALQSGPTRNATAAALADRVALLERQLQSERLARQSTASDARTAYERCLADRRTDCDLMLGGATPAPAATNNRPTGMPGPRPTLRPTRAS